MLHFVFAYYLYMLVVIEHLSRTTRNISVMMKSRVMH